MFKRNLLLVCGLLLVILSHAQRDTLARLDSLLNKYLPTIPGAQLAISRNGQVIYSSAKGLADLEHAVPLTTTSRIEAGSVSKQFTAAAILILESQGKLSVNDNIRKYIPELPDYGTPITIRHLMQHTSGLRDWGSIAEISGWPRGTKAYTNDDALQIIITQKKLNNKPGDEYIYSNSGYTLMVHIVQRVSGMSHAEFTKKFIFEPAGMTRTEWRDDYRRVVPERAIAYSRSSGTYITNMPNENTYGHGGLLTTAEDLLKWNSFYTSGKLGASLMQKQTATTALNNGRINNYAAGLVMDSVESYAMITHNGATAGYRANLDYIPALGLSIAWLSNNALPDFGDLPDQARNLFIPGLTGDRGIPMQRADIPVSAYQSFTGAYKESRTGAGLRISIRDGYLVSEPNGRMVPVNAKTARVGRATVLFSEKPRSLRMITPGGDTIHYTGTDTARLDGGLIDQYTGTYASEETGSVLSVLVKNGKLFTRIRSNEVPLTPAYKDGFSFPGGDLYFERDGKGKINRLYISISRARKVEFTRK